MLIRQLKNNHVFLPTWRMCFWPMVFVMFFFRLYTPFTCTWDVRCVHYYYRYYYVCVAVLRANYKSTCTNESPLPSRTLVYVRSRMPNSTNPREHYYYWYYYYFTPLALHVRHGLSRHGYSGITASPTFWCAGRHLVQGTFSHFTNSMRFFRYFYFYYSQLYIFILFFKCFNKFLT